jgi:uncharacterized protein (DUF924 family)
MNDASHDTPEAVLAFWFGTSDDDAAVLREKGALWWAKSDELDRSIRERFGELRERARRGELAGWLATPRGRLAVIVLLDQFSRNLFRGSPESFAADARALALALEGIRRGEDKQLRPVERVFLYMPLMHAEQASMQDQCVTLFERLRDAAPEALREAFASNVKFAEAHRDIVWRFGRFPHRNQVLGRTSTAEEIEFLTQPGSSF